MRFPGFPVQLGGSGALLAAFLNEKPHTSEPQRDFTGGEFVLTAQRPRMQSRPEVVSLRHDVSRLRSGQRYTVGIIFHDAK